MPGKTFEECMEEACRMGIAASQAVTPEQAAWFLSKMAGWLELAKLGYSQKERDAAVSNERRRA
jgi:hypothetical protein